MDEARQLAFAKAMISHTKSQHTLPYPHLPTQDPRNWDAYPQCIMTAVVEVLKTRLEQNDMTLGIPHNIPTPAECPNCSRMTITRGRYISRPEAKTPPWHLQYKDCGQRIPGEMTFEHCLDVLSNRLSL